jgi:hypothetical protein
MDGQELKVVNSLLTILPARYMSTAGGMKRRVIRLGNLRMILTDPLRAGESGRKFPNLDNHFEILEKRFYGGSVLQLLLSENAQNFLEE